MEVTPVVPAEIRGTGFGVLASVNGIGDLLSSTLVGAIWSAAGATAGFGLAAVLCGLGTVSLALAAPPSKPPPRATSAL